MEITLSEPGTYIIAVSGGVDSMALLNLLHKKYKENKEYKLVVAHLDHGIRPDSYLDRQLVEETAKSLNLPFVFNILTLGSEASEDQARQERYAFLDKVASSTNARSIITAHHQDDLLETAIINIMRGSGRKGLTSLASSQSKLRPLLNYTKADLVNYAKDNQLTWRDDPTNEDTSYLRNYVRHKVIPRLDKSAKQHLTSLIDDQKQLNEELDSLLESMLSLQLAKGKLNRSWFISLSHDLAKEVLASWLRANNIRNFNSKTLENLVVKAKTAKAGTHFPIQKDWSLSVQKDHLALKGKER